MTRIIASLFALALFSSSSSVFAEDRTLEQSAAMHAHVLVYTFHELGIRASESREHERALHLHAAAATLSLSERELVRSTAPIYCGAFYHREGRNTPSGHEYCAATLSTCNNVVGAAQSVFPNTTTHTDVTACHKKD